MGTCWKRLKWVGTYWKVAWWGCRTSWPANETSLYRNSIRCFLCFKRVGRVMLVIKWAKPSLLTPTQHLLHNYIAHIAFIIINITIPSLFFSQLEILHITLMLYHITNILNDLFFMQLVFKAGEMPDFTPEPVFNPMKTLVKYEWSFTTPYVCFQFLPSLVFLLLFNISINGDRTGIHIGMDVAISAYYFCILEI